MAAIVFPVLFLGAGLGAALYFLNSGPVLGSGDASSAADFVATPVPENRPAPSFSVPSLDGLHAVTSAALARRVVVINLWASWCAPCREEAPDLRRLWLAYRAKGIGFIGIDPAMAIAAPVALSRAVSCVVDNAVRAAGPGGQVTVDVNASCNEVTILVIDDGPGLGKVATNNSLGLTITRALVSACGGAFELRAGSAGGAVARIVLPATSRASVS